MNCGFLGGSSRALRTSRIYLRNISGCTYVSGQTAASSSSAVTNRPACSTRWPSTAKAFGANGILVFSRHKHWLTASSRYGGNTLMAVGMLKSRLYSHENFTETQQLHNGFIANAPVH